MRQTPAIAAIIFTAFASTPPLATAAFISGANGTSATMLGSNEDEDIVITTEGTAWLAHNRFTVGDPGFVSNLDFDSIIAGEQRIPNTGESSVNIVGAAGFDTLSIHDDKVIIADSSMRVREDHILLGNNRPVIHYSGLQKVNIRPNDANNSVYFESTSSDATYEAVSHVNQRYSIGTLGIRTLDNIQGPISVSAGAWVDVNDSENTENHTYSVDRLNRISRTGIAPLDLSQSARLRIFHGSGNNQFNIMGNASPYFEISGTGTSTITLGDVNGTLNDIRHPVLINPPTPSAGGTDIVNLIDTGSGEPHEYALAFDALVRNDAVIAEGTIDQVTLNCGPFSDTIWTEPGSQAHINAGTGSSFDLMIFNQLFFPGLTTVNGDTSTITDPQFQPVSFTGIDHLYLFGGKEANSLAITPSAEYLITADAGDAAIAPADSLKLEASGLPFIQTADAFLVYGKKLVNFYGFESVEGPPAPPPPPPPPADGADLTGGFTGVTLTPDSKGRFKVTAQFNQHNAGNQGAGKSVTRFFLSADTTISPDDLLLKTQKIKLMAPGQQRAILFKKKLPATINPTGMFLIARVDDLNQVADRDHGNDQVLFGPIF